MTQVPTNDSDVNKHISFSDDCRNHNQNSTKSYQIGMVC